MDCKNITVIIPAYKLDERLIYIIEEIKERGFSDVLVVDCESGTEYSSVFDRVRETDGASLIALTNNKGKGAALKAACTHIIQNRPDCIGVVIADADGQFQADDTVTAGEIMTRSENIVLGVRSFSGTKHTFGTKLLNIAISAVLRLFFGMKLSDSQASLRAIPIKYLQGFSDITGNGSEYETNALFHINRNKLPFEELIIHNSTESGKSHSHIKGIWESIRIFSVILKYLFSAVASFAVDYIAFLIFKQFKIFRVKPFEFLFLNITDTFPAIIAARVISSIFNYMVNSKVVFEKKTGLKSVLKYYTLALAQVTVSATAVTLIEDFMQIKNVVLLCLVKLIIESVLFLFTFRFQDKWVFKD